MAAIQEQKTGTIASFYDTDTGIISESDSNITFDFYQPGAQVDFGRGDYVDFLKITLPNGRVIVNDIKRRNN